MGFFIIYLICDYLSFLPVYSMSVYNTIYGDTIFDLIRFHRKGILTAFLVCVRTCGA